MYHIITKPYLSFLPFYRGLLRTANAENCVLSDSEDITTTESINKILEIFVYERLRDAERNFNFYI